MTNDAAVAWVGSDFPSWANRETEQMRKLTREAQPEHGFVYPLYSATTVAELRAAVEKLRVQLAGCGVIAMSNTRDSLAEQMPPTSAYGWSPSLVEVHDAVFREIQNRERADAAERREADLLQAVRELQIAESDVRIHEAMNPRSRNYRLPIYEAQRQARERLSALTKESP